MPDQSENIANRPLRVFLCHSSNDKPAVRELYQKLRAEPWIQLWLDEEELYPGQDWNMEIEKAVEASDAVLVCLSNNSINKRGYVQKELRLVLDIALEMPEETIFIIPLRLEECNPPRSLREWHYADYFPEAKRERAFQRLLVSLRKTHGKVTEENRSIGENSLLESLFKKRVIIVENSLIESLFNKREIILKDKPHNINFIKRTDNVNTLVGKQYGWAKVLGDSMNGWDLPFDKNDYVLFCGTSVASHLDYVITSYRHPTGDMALTVKRFDEKNNLLLSKSKDTSRSYDPIPLDRDHQIVGIVIAVAKPEYIEDNRENQQERNDSPNSSDTHYDKLLELVRGYRPTANRLINYEKSLSPKSSRGDCIERAITRLLRDRDR
jgi:hypothetical protein